MNSIAKIIVIASSLMFFAQVSAQDISEPSVREFLVKFDKAISSKNATEIGKLISENADFSGKITAAGQVQSFRLNKAQYIAALRDTWAQASNYTYRRTSEKIVTSGGKATITADVFESMNLQGKSMATKSKDVATVEKINGVLLMTKVVSDGSMQ